MPISPRVPFSLPSPVPARRLKRCANSVLLELESLRQLRTRPPTINRQNYVEDLSYVENKIRSVILGDETVNLFGKASELDKYIVEHFSR